MACSYFIHQQDPSFNPKRPFYLSASSFLAAIFFCCSFYAINVNGSNTEIETQPCVRLFHSKGDFGCSTSQSDGKQLPVYGVIEDLPSLNTFIAGTEMSKQKVAAVLSASCFNASIIDQITADGKVGALLVLDDGEPALMGTNNMAFSTDVTTPMGDDTPFADLSLAPSHAWNPAGNGLAWRALGELPAALVAAGAPADAVRAAAAANARSGIDTFPVYHANLEYYFGPSEATSRECLAWEDVDGRRDPQCLPLGGQSVWGTLGPRDAGRPAVLAVAGMDSAAFFHDRADGANDAAASVAALLSAAEALGRASEKGALDGLAAQPALALFQAEEWGYVGSRRFARDLAGFACANEVAAGATRTGEAACLDPLYPSLAFRDLTLDQIQAVVAVDQVGIASQGSDGNVQLYVTGNGEESMSLVTTLISTAADNVDGLTVTEASAAYSEDFLPPTPATSFVKAKAGLSAAVVSGYDTAYVDPAYHTPYDTGAGRLDAAAVTAAADLIAQSLYALAGGDATGGLGASADPAVTAELLDCLTQNGTCALARGYLDQEEANLAAEAGLAVRFDSPGPSKYAGVLGPGPNRQPTFTRMGPDGVALFSAGRFGGAWDAGTDTVSAVPSHWEAFTRAYLADQLTRAPSARSGAACATSADCAAACPAGGDAKEECVAGGACACRAARLHLALDVGLEATEALGVFDVVEGGDEDSPIVTEPNWKHIGVEVYLFAGDYVCYLALALGVFVTAASTFVILYLKAKLRKEKLL